MILVIVYVDLVPQLQCISLDDLKYWGRVDALQQNNIFFTVFDCLSKCVATGPAYVHGTTDFDREGSPESDLSTSSAEDNDEEPSRGIFRPLTNPIILHGNFPGILSSGYLYKIKM
jgi:hypothetical protein